MRLSIIIFAALNLLSAQPRPASEIEIEPFHKRFSFGIRAGGLITNLISSRSVTESTTATDPATSTTTYSNSAARRYTLGPCLHFRVTDRLGLNLDFLYKRAGYDSGAIAQTQELNEDTDLPDLLSAKYERTRADFWEVPILARYYRKASEEGGARIYLTGGLNFRAISGIKTFRETINADGLSDTDSTPAVAQRKDTQGGVAGVGIQFRDEVGLKIEFEIRYTRWLRKTLELGPTSSGLNQAEGFLALTF